MLLSGKVVFLVVFGFGIGRGAGKRQTALLAGARARAGMRGGHVRVCGQRPSFDGCDRRACPRAPQGSCWHLRHKMIKP